MNRDNYQKIIFSFIKFFLMFAIELFGQDFKVVPLISIPGDNTEVDVSSYDYFDSPNNETYICWLNKVGSTYTVYLKQLSPILSDNIVVVSDTLLISKPSISTNRDNQGFKIVWEIKRGNTWRVYLSNYLQNQLSEPEIILDSLMSDPQISLSIKGLAWINNGNLLYSDLDTNSIIGYVFIDSLTCSSPDIIKNNYENNIQIVYEKGYGDSTKIDLAEYRESTPPEIHINVLSKGLLSKDPKFGMNMDFSFQIKENNVWKSVYSQLYTESFDTTKNQNCNYDNSAVFTYPTPITIHSSPTPFFLAFDTDSIPGNNEIFIKTYYYGMYDSLINVSNAEGNDRKPQIAYLSTVDSIYISIIWEHRANGKTDLWIAKDNFIPISTGVKDKPMARNLFKVSNNYPNPFNPATTIEYTLANSGNVKIVIYDVTGREIETIVNEYKKSGNYKIVFNAANLSSGIYYYQLQSGNNIQTKSMLLLK